MEHKIKVGITQGDINGVGYEVILKTLSDPHIVELCTPVVYGSAKVAAYHRKALDIPAVNFNIISDASAADENKVNLITCVDDDVKVEIGKATAIGGEAAYAALERAAADMEAGSIDVLLTAPINKHAIQSDKFDFPGHTEYLERRLGNGQKALMILLNDTLRVALVSGHVPVSKVSSVVTKETILEKLQIFEQSLRQDFCVVKPRIAVLALNPHAGDDGLLGTEEIEIIKPAIQEANAKGMLCFWPLSGRWLFRNRTLSSIRRCVGYVSRSRIGAFQGDSDGRRGELYGRITGSSYFSRSWYGIRHSRTEPSRRAVVPSRSLFGDRCIP